MMRATLLLVLALGACGEEPAPDLRVPTVSVVSASVEACDPLCAVVTLPEAPLAWDLALESDRDGFYEDATVTANGATAEICATAPFTPGSHQLAVHTGASEPLLTTFDAIPFGSGLGLGKPSTPLTEVPWVPAVENLDADPILAYSEGAWDGLSVMMSSTVRLGSTRFLYYAGTPATSFQLGIAWRDEETEPFEKYHGNPILAGDADWKREAQNTPEAVAVEGDVWLYYNGRAADGTLSVGLATSSDGLTFEDHPDNPVLSPTGRAGDFDSGAVAHPSVLVRDGVFEMWYASGTLKIGYAVSEDGVTFERYCGNPVFEGDPTSWDRGSVKAPEVVYREDRYWMTYSGCGQGCYQVGWAVSDDGLRWVAADEPLLPVAEAGAWSSYGTQAAFIEWEEDALGFWFTGTGNGHGQLGLATATR